MLIRAQDLLWLNREFVELKQMLANNPGLRISIFVTREDTPHIPFCCNRPGKQAQLNADPEKGPTTNVSSTSSDGRYGEGGKAYGLYGTCSFTLGTLPTCGSLDSRSALPMYH